MTTRTDQGETVGPARGREASGLRELAPSAIVDETIEATLEALPFPCGARTLAGDDVIYLHDNTASARFFGRTAAEMRGLSGRELGLSPSRMQACVASLTEASRERGPIRYRARHRTATGARELIYHVTPLSFDGSRFISVIEDVTDLHRLEGEAAHAERLAAVGTLTAALAHDMAGPATIALGCIENSLRTIEVAEASPPFSPLRSLRRDLAAAKESLAHVIGILRAVRSYTSPSPDTGLTPCDLNAVVESALQLAGPELRARARIVFERGKIPPVRGSVVRLGQVILNLAANAARAASLRHPLEAARITVRTLVTVDGRVKLEVSDNGDGLSGEVAGLFQPFATRHEGGTGLGLFISKRIIESFGGTIEIANQTDAVDSGTIATVLLLQHRDTE